MSNEISGTGEMPNNFVWLADAPLFIDTDQVYRFYDAVVRPETAKGTTTLEITKENARQISGKLGLEAGIGLTELGSLLTFFPFLKPEVKASGEGTYEGNKSEQDTTTIELHPIQTPQRQLVLLALHYYVNLRSRVFFVDNPADEDWRSPQNISSVPRELVFLDLPGQEEAVSSNLAETKIIPTAAEFGDGKVVPLFNELVNKSGEAPPLYPEKALTLQSLRSKRRAYWRWFDENFSATQSMSVVEKASTEHGRIRWIDYRVPVTKDGDTLHLHVVPAGNYDAGVLAYNFIKRGYKHGLRLVGTLRSEPSMNILAIYDK